MSDAAGAPSEQRLHLLCAGAARGLVRALEPRFRSETGATVDGRFGAVGAMRELLLGGAPCDVIVLSDALIDALRGEGRIAADMVRRLGRVATGVAVRSGEPHPPIGTDDGLRRALLAARAVHVPDLVRSTAGAHMAAVFARLGIADALRGRLAEFPNGAAAMQALAERGDAGAIGCTQASEILYTPGLDLVGTLAPPFDLATVYTAAVAAHAADHALAARFVDLLGGDAAAAVREAGGFAPLLHASTQTES